MEAVLHILDGACSAYYVTDGNKLIALHFVNELRFGNRYKLCAFYVSDGTSVCNG